MISLINPKKCFVALIFFVILALLYSCSLQYEKNDGYPKTVKFTSEGGQLSYDGGYFFTNVTIDDFKTDKRVVGYMGMEDSLDYFSAQLDWLTVRVENYKPSIELIAEPNTSNTKRELVVLGSLGNTYAYIKVRQEGVKK